MLVANYTRAALTQPVPTLPIPAPVFYYRGLTPGAKVVYTVLYTRANNGFVPGLRPDKIGRVCGLHPNVVSRYIGELMRRGFVAPSQDPHDYQLLKHPVFGEDS